METLDRRLRRVVAEDFVPPATVVLRHQPSYRGEHDYERPVEIVVDGRVRARVFWINGPSWLRWEQIK